MDFQEFPRIWASVLGNLSLTEAGLPSILNLLEAVW
jgi:hypothetical protein